jgi:hypothetical protein
MNCNWLISVRRFGSTEEPANEIYVTRELGSGIQPMLELLDYCLVYSSKNLGSDFFARNKSLSLCFFEVKCVVNCQVIATLKIVVGDHGYKLEVWRQYTLARVMRGERGVRKLY